MRETWKEKKRIQEPANPDNLENRKEAGGEAQGTQGLSKKCTIRERVSLNRVCREVFVISIIRPVASVAQLVTS